MLTCLRVRSLAVVDEIELDLGPGLNVITGETGAGKSILIAALQLVLGARGRADRVRTGHDEAVVEALFDLDGRDDAVARLEAVGGAAEEPELLVRRVVRSAGRSRAYVNGTLVTGAQLVRVTRGLVDICSQHEHHSLVDPASHQAFLDAYGVLQPHREAVRTAWQRLRGVVSELEDLAATVRARGEREAILRFQLDEIDAVDPLPDEEEALDAEQQRLAHADRIARATSEAEDALYAGDDAVSGTLLRLAGELRGVRHVDPALEALADRLDSLVTDLEDLGRDFGRHARGCIHDPRRLAEVEDRLGHLRRLARKYGGTHAALLHRRAELQAALADLGDLEGRLDALEALRQEAADALGVAARALSEGRRGVADGLGEAITGELADLGMGDARVRVDVDRLPARQDGLEVDGLRVSATGMDRVEFLIAPNRGEPPRPLQRIASGGELSRALLAIKRVLADRGPRSLYVFDEVDVGVGGAVAAAVGRKLRDVARDHQVLCITHSPQVAAWGDRHVQVRKEVVGERSATRVAVLDHDARVEELARMLGGEQVTDATRDAARALLAEAEAGRA